jgi:hypothetical protein
LIIRPIGLGFQQNIYARESTMLRPGIALIVAGAVVLAAALFVTWDAIPSVEYIWAEINQNLIPGQVKLSKQASYPPARDPKEMAGDVISELRYASDDELTAIRSAKRPCYYHLVNCYGLSEAYVRALSAAEYTRRTEAKVNELKERAQKSADASAEAALKNAEAAYISAKASQSSAETAHQTLFWTAATAICGGLGLVATGLGFVFKKRKRKMKTP